MSKIKDIVVIKRDGREVDFNATKIEEAIYKAVMDTDTEGLNVKEATQKELAAIHATKVVETIVAAEQKHWGVDDIQEVVKTQLMRPNSYFMKKVAKSYIEYAAERKAKREYEMDIVAALGKLTNGDKDLINANANKDSRTFPTQRDLRAGQVAKSTGLGMLPNNVRDAHLRGDIHFHDLDYAPDLPYTNCLLVDLKFMLSTGFNMGNAAIGSPKSVETAVAQTAQIVANVASSQYGGTSLNRLDEVLEPYARMNYEKHKITGAKHNVSDIEAYAKELTAKDIYDSIQSLEYEINTLYTSNGQTPFTTVGFGLSESWFGREIQKAILKVRLEGLGVDKKTAIFPKLLFTIKDGLNLRPEDPNYDIKQLALLCASRRMYPDVLNYDKIVELTGSFKASMGCRSFLQGWTDENGEDVTDGRMNLGVVTLNLPRIALQSEGSLVKFWKIFYERMGTVHDALRFRKERTFEAQPENAPILYKFGAFGKKLADTDNVAEELFLNKRATISIGYIGLYEVGTVFFGPEWESNDEARAFTIEIVRALRDLGTVWGNEEGIHYSVYATPSEALTDRFCKLDTEKFGIIEDITDKEYYTNSFHYDTRKKPTPFEKIDFEMAYPKFSSGGFIHYVEYPNVKHNLKALEAVWDYSYDKVGYLGTNTPIDKCYECGSEMEFVTTEAGFECASCGNSNPETCDCVRRTCGYLGNPLARPMIHGRHAEIASRVKHM